MEKKFLILLLIFILFGVYWHWFLPGPRVATDFSLISQDSLKSLLGLPRTWSMRGTEGLGEYTGFTLWSWPFNLLFGALASLGLPFALLERILIVVPFLTLGIYGIWKLCKSIHLSIYATVISILIYLSNTYILLVIDGGQLSIGLAYAFFPVSFLALDQAIKGSLRRKILAGLLIALIGFFDIRFLYVFLSLSLFKFLYDLFFTNLREWKVLILDWLKTGLVIGLIILGLNAYWILILVKFPLSSSFYTYLTQTAFTSFISIGHSMLLQSPHWFKNVFGNVSDLNFAFILIPILVFLAPILKPKNHVVGFWLIVAIISIFLTKGTSAPLPDVYKWLFYHIPGFSLFRDSSKSFFLIALSYSVLIGITTDEIIKRIESYKIKVAFVVILIAYFIFIIKPVWFGLMTGTFLMPPLQKEYSELDELISEDQVQSGVFWIPTISPLTNLNPRHPAVEAARLAQKRPFAQANVGTYELFNYLREASYMGQLFDVAGIGYIVYPYLDPRRDNLHPDNIRYYYIFSSQLSKLSWLSQVKNSPVPLFKVKEVQNKFFITPNVWWVIGSDSIYQETIKSSKLSLSKNALIFPEEIAGLGKRVDEMPDSKIVLYHKEPQDLAASFIRHDDLIFPAKNLNRDPDSSGWWKKEASDLLEWRYFLKTKYGIDNQDFDLGGGWAIGEGNKELKINDLRLQSDKILLARVMESSRSGNLGFYQGDQLIGNLSTKTTEDPNVRWFEVGQLRGNEELKLASEGSINVVNALAIVDKNEWLRDLNKVKDLEKQNRIVDFNEKNIQNSEAEVSFRMVDSTKYRVKITNLKKPAFLVFSQNFDHLWKINNQSAFPVYSLLNGFWVKQDGEYIVEFEPQKFVYPGLVITGLTVVSIFFLLIQGGKRSGSKL